MITVKFKKLDARAKAPYRATDGSAGWDLCTLETIHPELSTVEVHTGIAIELPKGYVAELYIRSSIAKKKGYRLINSAGIIDSDYRGEITGNLDSKMFDNPKFGGRNIDAGDRVFQLLIKKLPEVEFIEVDELGETERGAGGYGSTGK